MNIDWFTFIAQVINFFILLWLLKRFLYQPILNAVDAREKKIAATLLNADGKKLEAEQQFDLYRNKKEAIEQKRASLFKQATDEAGQERGRLINEGRKDAEILRVKHMENLIKSVEQLKQGILQKTKTQVFSITRKVLTDLASVSLEQTLVDHFLAQLHDTEKSKKDIFIATLNTTGHPMLLCTAFELTSHQQASIQAELDDIFESGMQLQFETDENLISGIELISNGQKLAWGISDYLSLLEKSMEEVLNIPSDSAVSIELESNQLQKHQ